MRKGRAVKGADSKERGRDGEGYRFAAFSPMPWRVFRAVHTWKTTAT